MLACRCTYPGCDRLADARGCCGTHYHRLRARVAAGLTTWAQLEAGKFCRPSRCPGRAPPAKRPDGGVPPALIAGYETGELGLADVAARLRVSLWTARERLRRRGVDTSQEARARRRWARLPGAPGMRHTAATLVRAGLTLRQVADRLGLTVAEARDLVTGAGAPHPAGEAGG